MDDRGLVAFLQGALPRLGLRWPGFRKVRGQVRKKLNGRLRELGLPGVAAYRDYLEDHPEEWAILGGLYRITISRFHRDRGVFEQLRRAVLPGLARRASSRGEGAIRCWSAGCAPGEEPYTLKTLWELGLPEGLARVPLRIVATDVDARLLERAREGRYGTSSLKVDDAGCPLDAHRFLAMHPLLLPDPVRPDGLPVRGGQQREGQPVLLGELPVRLRTSPRRVPPGLLPEIPGLMIARSRSANPNDC